MLSLCDMSCNSISSSGEHAPRTDEYEQVLWFAVKEPAGQLPLGCRRFGLLRILRRRWRPAVGCVGRF